MPLAANAYAIGPGLYDWDRDELEREEAMEAAIESEAEDNKDYLASISLPNKSEREYIGTMMDEALTLIADQDGEQFNRWLWQVWACKNRPLQGRTEQALTAFALEQLMKMLDSAIFKVALKQVKDRLKAA